MPQLLNSRLGFPITHPGYIYSCDNCGGEVTKKPCMTTKEKAKKESKPIFSGLGGWRCKNNCGVPKRFVSVTRDLSGGKEQEKSQREVSWSVSRHLKISRKLAKQEEVTA